ncbi:MAG: hypothetical protein K9N49_09030 [Candidatus Marinimicrobia bacterium]|nr:hypothetical protein [Candidatus Neomarinimicrobiota bacterium]
MSTNNLRSSRANRSTWLFALLIASGSVPAGEILAPTRALIKLDRPQGFQAGVQGNLDRRSLQIAGEPVDLDIERVAARLGVNVLPFLNVNGSLGWMRAEQPGYRGNGGLTWSAEAEGRLLELPLYESVASPRKQSMLLSVGGGYRHSESNFSDALFNWQEWRVQPTLTYLHDRVGEPPIPSWRATGLAARVGLVFSQLRGTYEPQADADGADSAEPPAADDRPTAATPGAQRVVGNRDFGLMIGVDVRRTSSWVMRFEGIFFGDGDRELGLAALYNF